MQIKKWQIALVSVFLMLVIVIIFGVYDKMKYTSKEGIRINIFQQGRETKLNPELDNFTDLQKKSESLFINADSALSLAVTSRTISKAKEGTAVEIIYSEPKEITVHPEKPYVMKVDALLVELGSNNAIIYYSMNGSYSAGPYVNTKEEVNELRDFFHN